MNFKDYLLLIIHTFVVFFVFFKFLFIRLLVLQVTKNYMKIHLWKSSSDMDWLF